MRLLFRTIARKWGLPSGQNPHGVDEAGNVAEEGEQHVDPKVLAEALLKKDAERGEQDGENDAEEV
jgi:hypothetical protein